MKLHAIATAFLPATGLAQVFPVPKGDYKVQWTSRELVDKNRQDPFNATHLRRMMISQFTPVPNAACLKTCRVPYMPSEIAEIEDAIFTDYLGDVGWPAGALARLEVEMCCKVVDHHHRPHKPTKKLPTILFGTGNNTTRLLYTGTAQHLAALGYEVIVMDHPYETDVVQFPDGEIIFGGRIGRDPNNTAELQLGLDVRSQDVSFVLDELRIRRTTYIGQSFGGASAATVMPHESRIAGGVNLDGALWGRAVTAGVPRPFLTFGSVGHNSSSPEEPSWGQFMDAMDAKYPGVWYRELSLGDSVHGSYYDMSLIGDVTGLREENEDMLSFFGAVTGERTMEVLQAYLGAFIEFTLLGGEEGVLAGESDGFPDVSFLRSNE